MDILQSLFPEYAVVLGETGEGPGGALHPEEAAAVARAAKKRKTEFSQGRNLAKKALAQLGIEDFPLLPGADRQPLWPKGVIGSLTHCAGFCGVAVAPLGPLASLGFDAEVNRPLQFEIHPEVLTARERAWVESKRPESLIPWDTVIFSAKESAYKCQFPLSGMYVDFLEVEVDIQEQEQGFSIRWLSSPPEALKKTAPLTGRYALSPRHIFTGATLSFPPAHGEENQEN